MKRIVIASPHKRNDATENYVRQRIGNTRFEVVRARSIEDLRGCLNEDTAWVFFPHWSWKVAAEIYQRYRCVIFHMTDLPYGRGGSPLQNLILQGRTETKISAIECVEEIDAGGIYLQAPLALAGSAEKILTGAAVTIGQMIAEIIKSEPTPKPQIGEPVYFERRSPAQSNLAAVKDRAAFYDHVRMLDAEGYPHAYLEVGGIRLEFSEAKWIGEDVVATVRVKAK